MPEELTRRAISCIAACQKIPPDRITPDSTFEELGIDSLDGINILFALENEFNINIPDEGARDIRSVRQMLDQLEKLLGDGRAGAVSQV